MLKPYLICDDRVYSDDLLFFSDLSNLNPNITVKNGVSILTNQDVNMTVTLPDTSTAFSLLADLQANLSTIVLYDPQRHYGPYANEASLKAFNSTSDIYENGVQYQLTITTSSKWSNLTAERTSATHSFYEFKANDYTTITFNNISCDFDFSTASFNGQKMWLHSDGVITAPWDHITITTDNLSFDFWTPPIESYFSGMYLSDEPNNWRDLTATLAKPQTGAGLGFLIKTNVI